MKNKVAVFLMLLPVIISLWLISAHFYRNGIPFLAGILFFTPFLLLIRKHYIAKLIQTLLFFATIEWFRITYNIALIRMKFSIPWIRFTAIMSGVALFTFFSIFIFNTKKIKNIYK